MSHPNETYSKFRERIAENILQNTSKGSVVMISIEQATHWIAGFNDGEKLCFWMFKQERDLIFMIL